MGKEQRFLEELKQLRQQERTQPGSVEMGAVLKTLHFTLKQLVSLQESQGPEEYEEQEPEEGRTGEQQGMFISVETYRQTMQTLRLLAEHDPLAVGMFARLYAEAEGKTVELATEEIRQKGVFAHLLQPPVVSAVDVESLTMQDADAFEVFEVEDDPTEDEVDEAVDTPYTLPLSQEDTLIQAPEVTVAVEVETEGVEK